MNTTWKFIESLLIKDVLLDGKIVDIFIQGDRFVKISPHLSVDADAEINGKNMAILPSFSNCHSHAAMTLLRSASDDIPLNDGVATTISPFEGNLSEDDVYWGARLACLEMIKSGTTFFTDTYWHWWGTAKAVHDMGMRAVLAIPFVEFDEQQVIAQMKSQIREIYTSSHNYCDRIDCALGAVSITSLSEESLRWLTFFAQKKEAYVHISLSLSESEVQKCLEKHGMRPIHYLNKFGLINAKFSVANALHLDESEIDLLRERKARIVHCPAAEMKSGCGIFNYSKITSAGIPVALGSGGAAWNNRTNMLEEMRLASLLAKGVDHDTTTLPARKSLDLLTKSASRMFAIDNGEIAVGKLADCILVQLDNLQFFPNHNDLTSLVYSAGAESIHTTICNGKVLMHNAIVENEKEIIQRGREAVTRVLSRCEGMGK